MINSAAAPGAARFTGQALILKNWRSGSKRFKGRSQQKRSLVISQTTGRFAAVPRLMVLFIFAGTAFAAFAQGPALSPSPLISLPTPPPAKAAATPSQPSPPPAFTRQDFESFLDALIPSQLQNR